MHVYKVYSVLLILVFFELLSARSIIDNYKETRANLIEEEFSSSLGGKLKLNSDEVIANEVLMKLKKTETDDSFLNPKHFNFSRHYFTYRNEIERSQVYQIIRRMPKGAALHIHSSLMLGADFMLNMTYEDHLYACYADNKDLKLLFAKVTPDKPCLSNWTLMSELRNASDDVQAFDERLKTLFTLYTEDKNDMEADINTVWQRFNRVIYNINYLLAYKPVLEKFIYKALQNFYDDNVLYVEVRSGLQRLYDLDGTKYDAMYVANLYQDITNKFIEDHPDFIGMKLILATHRTAELKDVHYSLQVARQLKKDMPDFLVGFDLVGQEDLGKPLKDYLPALIEAKGEIDYYFHGGETNWYGTATDENLVDAILLGSKRIGHAFALTKHPALMAVVKEKDIALEVNVISNSVLCLVQDVRNHPLSVYLAFGFPVVLSSDDPGVWGADPLSHDFYVAFVGIASEHADLRMLKQLALNSIRYSSLESERKDKLNHVFNKRWDDFIEEVSKLRGNSGGARFEK